VEVRICRVNSERVGHFISDISEHLARSNIKGKNVDFFYFGDIANEQWATMAKRTSLRILGPWLKYVEQWNYIIPGGQMHKIGSSLTESRDIENLFGRFDVRIPFLASENDEGTSWLRSKGWTEGEPYICLLVRDSTYLNNVFPDGDFRYHDYRDSDIDTYATAMEWLASQGVWVLRMGKLMEAPFQSDSSRIIDYAFDPEKSDLLDIWLFANCNGVISTATGLDQLAAIYGKPQLYLNALPLAYLHSWSDVTWVPKNLRFKEAGKSLSLQEHFENSFLTSLEYRVAGIEIVDLCPAEITAAVMEFWLKICDSWVAVQDDINTQKYFWDALEGWHLHKKMHGFRHPKAVIGKAWLVNQIVAESAKVQRPQI
jgi:putative glycosyltransferase (TIGR04372 family)